MLARTFNTRGKTILKAMAFDSGGSSRVLDFTFVREDNALRLLRLEFYL